MFELEKPLMRASPEATLLGVMHLRGGSAAVGSAIQRQGSSYQLVRDEEVKNPIQDFLF